MAGLSLISKERITSGVATLKRNSTEAAYDVAVECKTIKGRSSLPIANELRAQAIAHGQTEDWPVPVAAELAIGFVPFAGPAYDIVKGVSTGNPLLIIAGVGFLALDFFTFGGASLLKGAVKAGMRIGAELLIKEGVELFAKKTAEKIFKEMTKQFSKHYIRESGEQIAKSLGKEVQKLINSKGAQSVNPQSIQQMSKELIEKSLEKGGALEKYAESLRKITEKEVLKELKSLKSKSPAQIQKALIEMGMSPSNALKSSDEISRALKSSSGVSDEILGKAFEDVITARAKEHLVKGGLLESFEKTITKELKEISELTSLSKREMNALIESSVKGASEGLESGLRKVVKEAVENAIKKFRKDKDYDLPAGSNNEEEETSKKVRIIPNSKTVVGVISAPEELISEEQRTRRSPNKISEKGVARSTSQAMRFESNDISGKRSFLVASTSFYGSDTNDYKGALVSNGDDKSKAGTVTSVMKDGTINLDKDSKVDVISFIPTASGKATGEVEGSTSSNSNKPLSDIKV